MGREIRKVPANYSHPLNDRCRSDYHKPLYYGAGGRFEQLADAWIRGLAAWESGERPDYAGPDTPRYYWDYEGNPPSAEDYMLVGVPDSECTHYMLFETTSEGTPISPAFETIEGVANYAERNCTTFADFKTSAAEWLRMLSPDGPGVSTVIGPGMIAL